MEKLINEFQFVMEILLNIIAFVNWMKADFSLHVAQHSGNSHHQKSNLTNYILLNNFCQKNNNYFSPQQ